MFWFAARTAWMVTKTAGGLLLTRTAGDRLSAIKNLIRTKPAEIGLKPATSFIKNYFADRAIANGPTKLRNTLLNIARLIYSAILSFVTYLAIELYNISNTIVAELSKYLIGVFNFGKDLLTTLTGTLSDAMMVTYTIFYLIGLVIVIYVLFRLVHHFFYSLFTLRSVIRALVDTVTGGAEEEQKNDDEKFQDLVKEQFTKSGLAKDLIIEKVGPNAVLVRKAPEPVIPDRPASFTPPPGSVPPAYDQSFPLSENARYQSDRFSVQYAAWEKLYRQGLALGLSNTKAAEAANTREEAWLKQYQAELFRGLDYRAAAEAATAHVLTTDPIPAPAVIKKK